MDWFCCLGNKKMGGVRFAVRKVVVNKWHKNTTINRLVRVLVVYGKGAVAELTVWRHGLQDPRS